MSRETFLARVRSAATRGRVHRVTTRGDWTPQQGRATMGADLVERMSAEVAAAGGVPHVVQRLADATGPLGELFVRHAPRTALCWQHPVLARLGLDALLADRGVERISYDDLLAWEPAEQRRRMLAADIGITSASRAIAETGTLVMMSAEGRERVASLLPPVHVAVIEAEQIVPDLFDVIDELDAAGAQRVPSNVTLITGPSKTGDLGLRLTTGVHGPGEWHVIIARSA